MGEEASFLGSLERGRGADVFLVCSSPVIFIPLGDVNGAYGDAGGDELEETPYAAKVKQAHDLTNL